MEQVQLIPASHATGAWYSSQAAEDTKLVYTGKAMLHRVFVSNANAAARFLWVWDNTAASGTILIAGVPIAIAGSATVDFPFGIPASTGLFVAMSTTQKTYTATAATDGLFVVGYAKRDVWP